MKKISILEDCLYRCKERCFKGYDPYDALNSKYIHGNYRAINILLTQIFKRSPINVRNLFGIEKKMDPMAIALFSIVYNRLYEKNEDLEYKKISIKLLNWLLENKQKENNYYYWGYNFPWQSRRSYLPKFGPCSVVTYFVGKSIIELYEKRNKEDILYKIARFYLEGLNKLVNDDKYLCLSYTPFERFKIVNSNALLASQLLLIGNNLENNKFVSDSERIIEWVLTKQENNGGWRYSPESHLGMDNFHNGYVITALIEYYNECNNIDLKNRLNRSIILGLKFYRSLFKDNGCPYFSIDKKYPIDIHNCSQGIITFKVANRMDYEKKSFYDKIFNYTLKNMWDESERYFYYQKNRLYTNKIPYMRWSQAWMCYAMSFLTECDEY